MDKTTRKLYTELRKLDANSLLHAAGNQGYWVGGHTGKQAAEWLAIYCPITALALLAAHNGVARSVPTDGQR